VSCVQKHVNEPLDVWNLIPQVTAMTNEPITPGQAAYVEDCRRRPHYPDGQLRRSWDKLEDYVQATWERDPTPREWEALS
jgi:hypothetical protein